MKIYLPFIFLFLIAIPIGSLSQCDSICDVLHRDIEIKLLGQEWAMAYESRYHSKSLKDSMITDSLYTELKFLEKLQTISDRNKKSNQRYCLSCMAKSRNMSLDTLVLTSEEILINEQLYPIIMYQFWQYSNDSLFTMPPYGSVYYAMTYGVPYLEKYPRLGSGKLSNENLDDINSINKYLKPLFRMNLEDFSIEDIFFLYQVYQFIEVKNDFKYPH